MGMESASEMGFWRQKNSRKKKLVPLEELPRARAGICLEKSAIIYLASCRNDNLLFLFLSIILIPKAGGPGWSKQQKKKQSPERCSTADRPRRAKFNLSSGRTPPEQNNCHINWLEQTWTWWWWWWRWWCLRAPWSHLDEFCLRPSVRLCGRKEMRKPRGQQEKKGFIFVSPHFPIQISFKFDLTLTAGSGESISCFSLSLSFFHSLFLGRIRAGEARFVACSSRIGVSPC